MTGQPPRDARPGCTPATPIAPAAGAGHKLPAGARAELSTVPAGFHGEDGAEPSRKANHTLKVEVVEKSCPQCGDEIPPREYPGGRPKVYCSATCAGKAARWRREGVPTRPAARSRRPLPDFAKDSAWRLRADIERIERIFADDRFSQYKLQVTAQLRGHLQYAAEVCQDLLSRIDHSTEG